MLQELSIGHSQKRTIRIAVSALFFLTGFCFASWASRVSAIQQKLHLSEGLLGFVLIAPPIGSMISMFVAGRLVNKYGSRQVLMVAGLLYGGILPTLGLVDSLWQLFSCLILFGFCGNVANIAVNTQAVQVEAMYGRPIMASFHGLWSTAGLTGGFIGSRMAANGIVPYQHFLFIMVIMIIIVGISIRFVIPQDMSSGEKHEDQPLFVFPKGILLMLGIIAFCSMICEGTMFEWSSVYFRTVIGVNEAQAVQSLTAFMSTMALFRFLSDKLTIRLGATRMLQLSGLFTAGGLLIAVLMPYYNMAIVGFLLVGAGVSAVVPLVYSAAGRSKVLSPGMALASVSTIGYLGFLAGPPLIGFIAEATSLRISFFVIALMGTCIAIMSNKVKE